jgi:hypothetical protein
MSAPQSSPEPRQNLQFRRIRLTAARLACAAFAWLLLSAITGSKPASAETVLTALRGEGLLMTQAQCDAISEAVWVSVMGRKICMRYYMSTIGGEGPRPVVFLQGDWGGPPKEETTDSLYQFAARLSKFTGAPTIYLARMGRDGSSGSVDGRHRQLELMATNAALSSIKARYHFEGFHLEGHSGGGNLVAGLLGWRRDISCAVPADGGLDNRTTKGRDPALNIFSPSDEIPAIARNRTARILVVTDPQGTVVRIENQRPFVDKLRKDGGEVSVFYVDSGGDEHSDHHFTTPHADLVMRDCIRGASYDEIAVDVADLVARRLKGRLAALKAKAQDKEPVATQR